MAREGLENKTMVSGERVGGRKREIGKKKGDKKTIDLSLGLKVLALASFCSLVVQIDQWDTYWGPKKLIFLIRDIDGPAMTAASIESCQSVAPRSPWGR